MPSEANGPIGQNSTRLASERAVTRYRPSGREGEPLMRMPATPQIPNVPTMVINATVMIRSPLRGRPVRGLLNRPLGVMTRASFQLRYPLTTLRRSVADRDRPTRLGDHMAIPHYDLVHGSFDTVLGHEFALLNRA